MLASAVLLAGCEGEAPNEAAPAIRPGLTAVQIEVVARPKSGYQASPDSAYDSSGAPDPRYATVNYSRLANVIVWLEPDGQAGAQSEPTTAIRIPLARPGGSGRTSWYVAYADTAVILQNASRAPDRFYSVSDGNPFDTGELAGNAEATVVLHRIASHVEQDSRDATAQVVEVFSTQWDEPVAGIVVAPTNWAASTRSGQTVTFTNLPPGNFRVVCWHPRLPGAEQRIQLRPNEMTRTQISIGVDSLPDAP
jgi:hypothetical protein